MPRLKRAKGKDPTARGELWGYLRVSGQEQAERGLPIAGMREAIQRWASEHGREVAHWFLDEARSGGSDAREAFQRMMQQAHDRDTACAEIAIWSWSRFARDQDDAHYWKASLRRQGIRIVDVSGETPETLGELSYVYEAMIHMRDAHKLEEVSRDARRGQQALAARGYVPSGCRPPRGYLVQFEETVIEGRRRRLRRWVPDPATWPLVERAWRLRLQSASYGRILRECLGLYRSPGCLSTFFANRIYMGELHFGATVIQVPAVVTAEEWKRVNARRTTSEHAAAARSHHSEYLLTGLLKCARCGAAVCGFTSPGGRRNDGYTRKVWRGYVCIQRRQHTCNLPRIAADDLEKAVIDLLLDVAFTDESLVEQQTRLTSELEEKRPELETRLERLRAELQRMEQSIERLLDLAEESDNSATLVKRLNEREAARQRLQSEKESVEAQLDGASIQVASVQQLGEELRAALDQGPPEVVRALIRRVVTEIIVDQDQAKVVYRLPFA